MSPDDPRHGTTRGYHAGCHDACCRRAIARYEKAGRLARLNGGRAVPAIGAQRRLQALMRLGWSAHRIAAEADLPHRNNVLRILNGQKGKPCTWVQKSTDEWVRRVYDRLSMRVPEGRYVGRTRAAAERQGWPPPLAWDDADLDNPAATPTLGQEPRRRGLDESVVRRVLAGEKVRANAAERAEIVRRWPETGRPINDLARLTGWKPERYKSEDAA